MVIVKGRNVAVDWVVYHKDLGKDKFLYLNGTNAVGTISNYWGAGGVTNSVVGLNTYSGNNGSYDYIAYCFANSDIIKAGSYTGNGSASGPMVFTGFRPSLILAKETGNARNWFISYDDASYYNGITHSLFPNISQAEDANERFDFLSNGFKLRTTSTTWNNSGGTYIYLAFASTPFKFSPAR
jgi:hypothetical protein